MEGHSTRIPGSLGCLTAMTSQVMGWLSAIINVSLLPGPSGLAKAWNQTRPPEDPIPSCPDCEFISSKP